MGNDYEKTGDDIWIHKSASVNKFAEIIGPCIIDENAEVRYNAYIRGSVIIGKNSVLGNSCEIKNSILYDSVQVPHFNYVGAFLGYNIEVGCGSVLNPGTIILSNTNIYPLISVRGVIESNSIVKDMTNIVKKI